MNAYTTMGQSRIQQHDISNVLHTHGYRAGDFLAGLERRRDWQAEAEVNWLLKQHGVTRKSAALLVSALRQTIGMALVRVGQGLVDAPHLGTATEAAAAGALGETTALARVSLKKERFWDWLGMGMTRG
jgi:hypothetical protein